ncbi:ABC transporter substrate-binding protein [Pleomorphomonas sp. JP5]|uniref:sugar ABC transporter substrate-binding protein n=1 Tax=Pleomorphomonas sp. JP5 TaxID=2942998 RepID=UPI0020430688|nr:ABC transporter substrate-binding protein [Pleomorphomonas sp. JP5]MCM5558980.1 ABC transporter substrate-binding protein [Pleomorphomonas sp. JP5]
MTKEYLKSRSSFLAVLALALPLATVVSMPTGAAASDVKSIRVLDYYNDSPDREIYGDMLNACADTLGVTVNREVVPGNTLIAKILQQGASRTLPDLLMIDNPDLQQIASTGALVPLTDLGLSGDGYLPQVIAASTYEGKLYGLQPITNTIALFYNVDVLKEAGVTPPTTWAELRDAAKKLTTGKRYGLAFSAPANYEGTWQFLPFMWSNGGDEKNLATPEVAGAIQFWVDLVTDGSVSRSVLNWAQSDVNDQFRKGNAAMMVNGPWQIPVLNSDPSLHYAVVSIPTPEAGGKSIAPLGGETWAVPNTGNEATEQIAAKMIACLNSDANQVKLGVLRQTVPTKTSAAVLDEYLKQAPSMKTFAEMVQTARARTAELGNDWPEAATAIYTAVQLALTGEASPTDALKQVQQ